MPPRGVAHGHVRLKGRGLVARIPRWIPPGGTPADALGRQAAAFARAEPSGCTPVLAGVIAPEKRLPFGVLVVGEVTGRPPRLPDDLTAIAHALAALHALPPPPPAGRPPLLSPADPVAAALDLVEAQAAAFDDPAIDPVARALLRAEFDAARRAPALPAVPPVFVGTDVHPGNFLIDAGGRAWFIDLEKAQYGHPGIDLAHATLYTSTRWDPLVDAALTADQVAGFERAWAAAVPSALAAAVAPAMPVLRRLTWLRTCSWMARWRRDGDRLSAGMPEALRTHMRRHVEDILHPDTIRRVSRSWTGDSAGSLGY